MSTSKSSLLTRGQAICLVLDMIPTVDNRRKANDIVDNNVFAVTYTVDRGSQHPFAMGKSIIEKNPFTYRSYPRTPPASPTLSPSDTVANGPSDNSDSGDDDSMTYSLNSLRSMAKSMFLKKAENEQVFDYGFFTTTDIYNHMKKQLPRLSDFYDAVRFGKIIKDKDFGKRISKRVDQKVIKGRMLYMLKDGAVGSLVESNWAFRKEIRNNADNWVNVGYVRKSPGTETTTTRKVLLNAMVTKLRNRCLCERIFASTSSRSSSPILERDYVEDTSNNSIEATSLKKFAR